VTVNTVQRCVLLQLCYEERIQDLETRNVKLHQDIDELVHSSRRHSDHLSVDGIREEHRRQVVELEQTIDDLRQELLRLRAIDLGLSKSVVL